MSQHLSSPAENPAADARTVTLAVLTYQRTDQLVRAVESMAANATDGVRWRIIEILVVDNNPDGSARSTVEELTETTDLLVRYTHEPTPGIVAARNRALTEAKGDVLVFIDDDEIALPGWPAGLLDVMIETGAAMVGGPVVSEFEQEPPSWAVESGFFDEEVLASGARREWLSTCNVAIDLVQTKAVDLRFDSRYPHGEDGAFSRLGAYRGLDLRWSATAKVKEFVPPVRTTLGWRRHRQRISTDAWVRAELDMDSSVAARVRLAAKALVRLAQAVVTTAAGALTRDRGRLYQGILLFSHVQGSANALLGYRRPQALPA